MQGFYKKISSGTNILLILGVVVFSALQCVGGVDFSGKTNAADERQGHNHNPLSGLSQKTDFTQEEINAFFDPEYLNENTATTDTMWCVKGTGVKCTQAELMNANNLKKVLIFPAGYTAEQYEQFKIDFNKMVLNMADPAKNEPNIYTAVYAERMLYIAYWLPGNPLGQNANFNAHIASHPINGKALSSNTLQVVAKADEVLGNELQGVQLFSVAVFFNETCCGNWRNPDKITAYAVPPNLLDRPFGVANFTIGNVLAQSDTPAHELAHSGLNFLDEYVSKSLADTNISKIDILTPLIIMRSNGDALIDALLNLAGTYSIKMSEIIAHNGNDNLATTRFPTTVTTDGFEKQEYEMEGGMFFGRGTWHDSGDNLMNDDTVKRGEGDDFAYNHSPSQQRIINQIFNNTDFRPNDRIRNAGPVDFFAGWEGKDTTVLLFDADKNHFTHPTTSYDVEVGWYDRVWRSCGWLDPIGLCYDEVWTTVTKTVTPVKKSSDLAGTALFGIAGFVQKVMCGLGIKQISGIDVCSGTIVDMFGNLIPGIVLPLPYMPYQEVEVPTPQILTRYYWRFRTNNDKTVKSGYTSWASFYRKL